jgi:predicted ATP-dependent protease
MVNGNSALLAELCAVLSNLAIIGSVIQLGHAQA